MSAHHAGNFHAILHGPIEDHVVADAERPQVLRKVRAAFSQFGIYGKIVKSLEEGVDLPVGPCGLSSAM